MAKSTNNKVEYREFSSINNGSVFKDGSRTVEQLLSPASVIYTSENELKIENNYVKGFVLNGYPSQVFVGWMNNFYYYNGDMDVAVFIEPKNERTAIDELTAQITKYEAQYMTEVEKGSIKYITDLRNKIDILMEQRAKLEQNFERLFHVTTLCDIFRKDVKELNKDAQRFQSGLSGSMMSIMPLDLRHDDAYMSCSPFGMLSINDFARNMNTGALGTMFPFYNSEVNDDSGTFIGINAHNNTPILINLFNRKAFGNANLFISGASGAGKSYFTSLIIMRSVLEGVRHCIIDPENEYGKATDALGGVSIRIAPETSFDNEPNFEGKKSHRINPFDIDEEVETDDYGRETGRRYVDIKGKSTELLTLFGIIIPDLLDSEVRAEMSNCLIELYKRFTFTENVESLYEEKNVFNTETGEYRRGKVLKIMPTMSDFRQILLERANETGSDKLMSVVNALSLYCKGGSVDLFDCHSTINFSDIEKAPIVRFDVKGIENDELRPIGMQVALTWAWNKFMKKDASEKKRIVCDEAWMLLAQAMKGSDYTANWLQNMARRVRKYNGSLCCASQHFREFTGRPEGQAILSNSAVRLFLKQTPEDIQAVGERFIMSDGEKGFLLSAAVGDMLIKVGTESAKAKVYAFPFEHELIKKEELGDD